MIPKNEKKHRDPTKGLNLVIFGEPNVGKTTFASSFPNALILNTDNNLGEFDNQDCTIRGWKYLKPGGKIPIKTPPKEHCFVNIVDEFLKGNHTYNTIVIDIGSHVERLAREYVLKRLELKFDKLDDFAHESDLLYAKGWDTARKEFIEPLSKLFLSEYNVVFITYDKVHTKLQNGREVDCGHSTDLRPAHEKIIAGYCHGVFELIRKNDRKTKRSYNVLKLNKKNSEDTCGNKLNIKQEYMEIELGYEYEDLCELIQINSRLKIKGE